MIERHIYSLLVLAPTLLGMKTLSEVGHVGENVTFICSDWGTSFDTTSYVKYLCRSPCRDVLVKAGPGETKHKNRIQIHNKGKCLFVTITGLTASDSQKFICGLEKFFFDRFIEVNLKVIDGPKTTTERVTARSTVSVSYTSSLSGSYIITNVSYPTLTTAATRSTTTGAESVTYLFMGLIVLITITMVLLLFMRMIKKKQLMSNAGLPQEDVEYEEIRTEDHQVERSPEAVSTIYSTVDTDPESLYANSMYHQGPQLAAACYPYSDVCLNTASKTWFRPRGSCAGNQVIGLQDDFVYSFAQLPKQQIDPSDI